MNERIKELAKQAGLIAGDYDDLDFKKELSAREKKFAELIVRECLSSLESAREVYANPGTYQSREYYERMDAKADALSDAIADLKSQFGIE